MYQIKIAKDFSRTPGGRHKRLGPASGEEFRDVLVQTLKMHPNENIEIIFDGAEGYGSSFLEEAFGGLVRLNLFPDNIIRDRLILTANSPDFETYVSETKQYIRDAISRKSIRR
ncbi:STAS-like domain-containing protein [Acetobacter tropicalis]|uniref:DUF4325 domain-containing protein n=1 Tax=Acetobacter tropicalis TaxID=104102 RepID=A0A291PJG0_9PROT|nr:STAS-like domain-containing protein [Acetobacter tropicalis]ATJ91531.1 hypothetical protein CIW82_13340 [Acetobacter tropicalis]